jgi:protein-S-isoprenylcysteine O-methyltransferase Ste14
MPLPLLWELLFWGWFAAEITIALTRRTAKGEGRLRDRGSQLVLWIAITLALTACEVIAGMRFARMAASPKWLTAAALILLVAGLAVRWTAILTLRKSFSVNVAIRPSQQICNTGLYRWIRHPSYLGLLLVFIAVGLHARNWISFGMVIALPGAALLYRIQVEERALREAFGEQYAAYAKNTSRLLPGIW